MSTNQLSAADLRGAINILETELERLERGNVSTPGDRAAEALAKIGKLESDVASLERRYEMGGRK